MVPEKKRYTIRWYVIAALGLVYCAWLVCWSPTVGLAAEYYLGEGDTIQISVFGNSDLTTTARVTAAGAISFPLIGQVPVAGLTVEQVADRITKSLADGYILDPQVSVSILEYRIKKSNIVGRVNRPGQYEFRGSLTFLELLSRAGGLAADAGSQALVKRKSSAGGVKAGDPVIDLKALIQEGDIFRDVEIMDEDIITVPLASQFFISGEVQRPGQFRFEEGMTIMRAVSLAGGFTDRAAMDRLKVVRSDGEKEQLITIGADPAALEGPVHRGDIIVVSAVRNEVYYITGEVKNAGVYRLERGANVLKAVALAGGFTDAAAKGKIRIVRRVNGQELVREKVSLEESVLPEDILVIPKSFF